ncbi:hypothetical protein EYZ11_006273 [Aspergillus tanneri]|uniref:Major facilitator superfamily (MFS) profile domain-containing protein n=1 Tax=Aspergillus tanneri TaxID=1220188 RepID=A0A4V3UPF9_9EURO|nr:hypothetical protein EYZ11_006273 [Aspergillus tanneri]
MVPQLPMFGRGRTLQAAITLTCAMAFILFGYDQGVFGGIVNNEDWISTFHSPNSGLEGIIVSVYNLGAFSGCILTVFTGEKMGRRMSMWFAMVWIIVGAILQSTAYSVPHLIIARYVTGIGTVPVYQSELCDANKRGKLISSEVFFIGLGIVIAYFFDYGMLHLDGGVAWRVPIACQIVFALAVIFFVLGIPESPRWLYYHDRYDEARKVLCDVWNAELGDPGITTQERDILQVIDLEKDHREYTWTRIFKKDEVQTRRRVLLAWGMQFMNQVCGINLIVYFMPSALQDNVGLSHNMSQLLAGVINCMFLVGAAIPSFLLDRMGRRGPMIYGSAGLGICMLFVAILLSFQSPDHSHSLTHATASASIAFFFAYMIIYSATAAVVPWAYVPEILPLHARAKGTAIGISSNWLWNFAVVMITPTIIDRLKWKAYLIFMCTNFAFIPLVYFFYPETTNLTLEEVDYLFIEGGCSASVASVSKHVANPLSGRENLQLVEEEHEKDISVGHLETQISNEV